MKNMFVVWPVVQKNLTRAANEPFGLQDTLSSTGNRYQWWPDNQSYKYLKSSRREMNNKSRQLVHLRNLRPTHDTIICPRNDIRSNPNT